MVQFRRIIQWFLLTMFLLGAYLFGYILYFHLGVEYNEEGRYFDADAAVVYHDQDIIGIGLIFAVFLIMAIISGVWIIRSSSNHSSSAETL